MFTGWPAAEQAGRLVVVERELAGAMAHLEGEMEGGRLELGEYATRLRATVSSATPCCCPVLTVQLVLSA